MIEAHKARLRALTDQELELVAQAVNSHSELLTDDVVNQADIVLALLKTATAEARTIIGKLTRFNTLPAVHPWPKPLPQTKRHPRSVRYMKRNLRLPRANQECLRVRMGMTLREVLEAGVSVCDVMAASRNGLVRFE